MRLREAVDNQIKSLVEIQGKPLTYYAINFLREAGAKEIIVLGAHDFENFKQKVLSFNPGVKVVEGDKRGSLYSLLAAWEHIDDSFLLCNADHIYRKPIAEKIKNQLEGLKAFCDFDRELGDDDMKVIHENGKLLKISKKLEDFNAGYVGLTYCDIEHKDTYKAAMDKVASENNGLVVEDILRRVMEETGLVQIGDISGHGWLEVDFPHELEKAKKDIGENPDKYFV